MSTDLLIEKLTNLQTFMRDNILVDMNVDDKRIKQVINEDVQKRVSDIEKTIAQKHSEGEVEKKIHQLCRSASKLDFTKELMDMSNIIEFIVNLDIEKELTQERLKMLEMWILKFIAPLIENDGQKLLRKLTLVAFHRLDPEYTVRENDIETIMKYFNFLYEYFQN